MLRVTEIIWLMQFVEKIREKHGLRTEEVEEVLQRHPRVHRIERGQVQGEALYRALGSTDAGRHVAVFFIHKGAGKVLVISAREMSRKERASYGKRAK